MGQELVFKPTWTLPDLPVGRSYPSLGPESLGHISTLVPCNPCYYLYLTAQDLVLLPDFLAHHGLLASLLSNFIPFKLWILLSNHFTNFSASIPLLNQPIRIPTSQMAFDILGRCIFWDGKRDTKTSHCSINLSASQPVKWPLICWEDVYSGMAKGIQRVLRNWHDGYSSKEDPTGFTFHLSFTISNCANLPHKDNNASPFTFVMWMPIKQTMGNLLEYKFEVQGGEFVFSDDSWSLMPFIFLLKFFWLSYFLVID
ncbi:hypothetical protein VP01_1234g2 [Puccinia sorghi]|uniref:Tet-like 2OG-Fe(II) oxygenase domain-containing protein n=1 Tax=Puccinia sorghi TaxID=27349 RepID=A0A0L6VR78_9BASI|nr:hypothetical protein VP01_1234g2 [Puccinia sorghi]